jgi:acetyl esterase/lipase
MVGCALSLLIAASAAPRAEAALFITDIEFSSPGAPGNSVRLDLYVPDGGVSTTGITILMAHGGSYTSGSRAELAALCSAIADRGYAVVDTDYTLASSVAPSYPQPISDILNAVHWIRTDGEALGLPNEVVLCGISAGSTIAITAAMAAETATFNHLPSPPHRGYIIDGAIGVMGRYDLVWNAGIGVPQYVYSYLGVPNGAANWMQTWSQASAVTYANACSPPTVLFHGSLDGLVPAQNSVRLQQSLQFAGVPVQLNIVPFLGHDMSILGYNALTQAQAIDNAAQWIDANLQLNCGRISASHSQTPPPPPPPIGACCSVLGFCAQTSQADCTDYWIADAACRFDPCPTFSNPLGRCCAPGGSCRLVPEALCTAAWSQGWSCVPNSCPQPPPAGRCCASDGGCTLTPQASCADTWFAFGSCDPNLCNLTSQTPGACCMGAACVVVQSLNCIGPNHRFSGFGSACNVTGNDRIPCCRADFNHNDVLAVSDIFDFLTSWFSGSSDSCITSPPTAPPAVQDIFDYLSAWFSGC